jgi:hypothetical protein
MGAAPASIAAGKSGASTLSEGSPPVPKSGYAFPNMVRARKKAALVHSTASVREADGGPPHPLMKRGAEGDY